jgi:hypothetical protein
MGICDKAFPGLVARVKQLIAESGLTIEVKEDCSCPSVELGDSGIGVSISSEAMEWLKNEKDTQRVVTYQAYATTYDPGVRYYPDGSGEPPGTDYVELGEESRHSDKPIVEAIKAYVEWQIYNLLDHEADEAMAREAAEAEESAREYWERDLQE